MSRPQTQCTKSPPRSRVPSRFHSSIFSARLLLQWSMLAALTLCLWLLPTPWSRWAELRSPLWESLLVPNLNSRRLHRISASTGCVRLGYRQSFQTLKIVWQYIGSFLKNCVRVRSMMRCVLHLIFSYCGARLNPSLVECERTSLRPNANYVQIHGIESRDVRGHCIALHNI